MSGVCLHVAMALFMAPETKGCLEGPVTEFTHVLPLKCQGRERGCMVKECV